MKLIKSLIAGITVCCLVCANVATLSASNTSSLSVTNSYGSAYTNYYDYSEVVGANHSAGYATLDSFKFKNVSQNVMPKDDEGNICRINARLYTRGTLDPVSNVAHYYGAGQLKSMTYFSGYGTVGAQYRLKTNSNSDKTYDATFTWGA